MADIVERLRGYNPPDRTLDEQRQIAVDIHEAADEIDRLRAALHWYADQDTKENFWIIDEVGNRLLQFSEIGGRAREALGEAKDE